MKMLIIHRIQENFKSFFNFSDVSENKDLLKNFEYCAEKKHSSYNKNYNYKIINKNINYLEILITNIKKNNHIPVLVTTPYSKAYNKLFFGKEWQDKYYFDIINDISLKFEVPYFDYSYDERLSDNKYFSDCDHLNAIGRKKFSALFFNDLDEYFKQPKP
jgi:hypothetical protein